jgi:hypothetical protein
MESEWEPARRGPGGGLVSHAGAALVAEAAGRLALTAALSRGLAGDAQVSRSPRPGRIVRDRATAWPDLHASAAKSRSSGEVASDTTAVRVIDAFAADPALLDAARAARARARENAWAQPPRVILDIDATLIGAFRQRGGERESRPPRGASRTNPVVMRRRVPSYDSMKPDRAPRPCPTVAINEDDAVGRPMSKPAAPLPVRDPVDESNKESFPASDPPSWWAGP